MPNCVLIIICLAGPLIYGHGPGITMLNNLLVHHTNRLTIHVLSNLHQRCAVVVLVHPKHSAGNCPPCSVGGMPCKKAVLTSALKVAAVKRLPMRENVGESVRGAEENRLDL